MLVIIGLVVGGVLVGRDLIKAAEVRAEITQIEKFNSAVNTFKGKFNALPGDMRPELVSQYGFVQGTSCTGFAGARDGNGLLDGLSLITPLLQGTGETGLFWQDLSSSAAGNLIDGTFPGNGGAGINCQGSGAAVTSGSTVGAYFPAAKIGHANYLYVYDYNGANWYGLSAVMATYLVGTMLSSANIPVFQAYGMDRKMDDGNPTTGSVQANYIASGANVVLPGAAPNTTTIGGNATSCYDTTTGTYSITYNNGNGGNCALSFKFQ